MSDWGPQAYMIMISAPGKFYAGVVADSGSEKIIKAAPIVKYMHGWTIDQVLQYCSRKCWSTKDPRKPTRVGRNGTQ